jgi:hypothetical protein
MRKTEERTQGITCENLGVEGICIDLEVGLTNENLKTPSEYDFREPFSEGLYLVLERVTIINNPRIVGQSEHTYRVKLSNSWGNKEIRLFEAALFFIGTYVAINQIDSSLRSPFSGIVFIHYAINLSCFVIRNEERAVSHDFHVYRPPPG